MLFPYYYIYSMSITNFLQQTYELKKEEKEILLPMLMEGFKLRTSENPIKAPAIVRGMNGALQKAGHTKLKFSEVRLRKLCNYIRSKSLMPLVATTNGYFLATTKKELEDQILSLRERASAIVHSAEGLQEFLLKM